MYVPTDRVCGCPSHHWHNYEGKCRWMFMLDERHHCACVQPTAEQREKEMA